MCLRTSYQSCYNVWVYIATNPMVVIKKASKEQLYSYRIWKQLRHEQSSITLRRQKKKIYSHMLRRTSSRTTYGSNIGWYREAVCICKQETVSLRESNTHTWSGFLRSRYQSFCSVWHTSIIQLREKASQEQHYNDRVWKQLRHELSFHNPVATEISEFYLCS